VRRISKVALIGHRRISKELPAEISVSSREDRRTFRGAALLNRGNTRKILMPRRLAHKIGNWNAREIPYFHRLDIHGRDRESNNSDVFTHRYRHYRRIIPGIHRRNEKSLGDIARFHSRGRKMKRKGECMFPRLSDRL